MNKILMLIVVLFPIFSGVLIPMLPFRGRRAMCILQNPPAETLTVFRFTGNLSITFRVDGMGALFAGMASFLWPLALLYSFEYMKHEHSEKSFFLFYLITYGITLGIALAENILTMYFFFEMLSMATLPLIMHTRTREAFLASRSYLYYMLGGAAFAFIGMIFILTYGTTSSFVPGGVLDTVKIGDKGSFLSAPGCQRPVWRLPR